MDLKNVQKWDSVLILKINMKMYCFPPLLNNFFFSFEGNDRNTWIQPERIWHRPEAAVLLGFSVLPTFLSVVIKREVRQHRSTAGFSVTHADECEHCCSGSAETGTGTAEDFWDKRVTLGNRWGILVRFLRNERTRMECSSWINSELQLTDVTGGKFVRTFILFFFLVEVKWTEIMACVFFSLYYFFFFFFYRNQADSVSRIIWLGSTIRVDSFGSRMTLVLNRTMMRIIWPVRIWFS